jgi:hypothetical protein
LPSTTISRFTTPASKFHPSSTVEVIRDFQRPAGLLTLKHLSADLKKPVSNPQISFSVYTQAYTHRPKLLKAIRKLHSISTGQE